MRLSHDADAILSFANKVMMVGLVSLPVIHFVIHWTISRSGYDNIIANAFHQEWSLQHRPVLSRGATNHTLYLGHSDLEPGGKRIICHHQTCSKEHLVVSGGGRNTVKVTCRNCQSWCEMRRVNPDTTTLIGRRLLVKTEYPQRQAEMEWRTKQQARQTSPQVSGTITGSPQMMLPVIQSNPLPPPSQLTQPAPQVIVTPAPELPQPPIHPQIIMHPPQTAPHIATPPTIIPSILPPLPLPQHLAKSSRTPTPVPPSPSPSPFPSMGLTIRLPRCEHMSIIRSQSAPQPDSHLAQLWTPMPKHLSDPEIRDSKRIKHDHK